jgi:signal transduction histidine kinase
VIADKQKCLQIMLNLLSNAIKFSPPDGEVGAEACDLGKSVEITVWDRGIGVATEDLDRIFRPFEQVERSNRTSRKGAGLGLAICKRLVEAHGGRIYAESDAGGGSRFVVELPKSPPAAVPDEPSEHDPVRETTPEPKIAPAV